MELKIHRIGGAHIDNLRLKPPEYGIDPPGISVLTAPTAGEAARQFADAFSKSRRARESARRVGSTNAERIREAGFDLVPVPTARFPNHFRIVHTEGSAGFTDANLARLAAVFEDREGVI